MIIRQYNGTSKDAVNQQNLCILSSLEMHFLTRVVISLTSDFCCFAFPMLQIRYMQVSGAVLVTDPVS